MIEKDSPLTKEQIVLISKTSSSAESLLSEVSNSNMLNNLSEYRDPEDNKHPGDASNITNEAPTTEQGETNSDEHTTMAMEYGTLLTSNMQHNKSDVEIQFKPDEYLDFEDDTQYQNAKQPMYNKMDDTQYQNAKQPMYNK